MRLVKESLKVLTLKTAPDHFPLTIKIHLIIKMETSYILNS